MFKEKIPTMNQALEILENLKTNTSLLENFVCAGVKYVANSTDLFDKIIKKNCPIKRHFFTTLKNLPLNDDGHWLELLEDLAFFFKQQKSLTSETPVPKEGQQLMEYFESSDDWKSQDNLLINTYYWSK